MKKILVLMLVLLASLVSAGRTCQDIIEPNTVCEIITPVIDCSTYDLYNSTLSLNIDDGSMDQIGTTGMYNFTFNQPDTGTHQIILCDNTTSTIEVAAYSQKVIYDNNLANFSTVQTDLDNPNQYKADVSALATSAQLTSNISNLQDYGDNNWSTQTGCITDQIMNDSHGVGVYNTSDATISASDKTDIAEETNLMINNSHGLGAYNSSGTAVISAADIATIANETFKKLIQNRTEVFFNNSLGYPVYDIWNYANDGITINITYGYWSDNMTILNRTYSRSP